MVLISWVIYFFFLVYIGYLIKIIFHSILTIKNKKAIVNSFVKKAMEELDDIDRSMGLLPPKPLPAPKSIPSYGKNYHYTKVLNTLVEDLTPIQQEFIKRKKANDQLKELALRAQRYYLSECECMICDTPGIHTHSDVPF